MHFSIAKGHRSRNLHCVGASSKLGGTPLIYFGWFPFKVGIESKLEMRVINFAVYPTYFTDKDFKNGSDIALVVLEIPVD